MPAPFLEVDAVLSSSDPAQSAALTLLQQTSPKPPEHVIDYLAKLALLYGVPFENLVPDARMLPPESMRFFYVDPNWTEAIVDGALSTGIHSSRDIRFSRVMRDVVREVTDEAIGEYRTNLRGETLSPLLGGTITGATPEPFEIRATNNTLIVTVGDDEPVTATVELTQGSSRTAQQIADELAGAVNRSFNSIATATAAGGFLTLSVRSPGLPLKLGPGTADPTLGLTPVRAGLLMRSQLVSGWPGLEIGGYATQTEADAGRIKPLRIERLSPDVMLVIFERVPAMIVINEPKETLHFGTKSLQALRNPGTGVQLKQNNQNVGLDPAQIARRAGDPSVLDIEALAKNIAAKIPQEIAGLTREPFAITPANNTLIFSTGGLLSTTVQLAVGQNRDAQSIATEVNLHNQSVTATADSNGSIHLAARSPADPIKLGDGTANAIFGLRPMLSGTFAIEMIESAGKRRFIPEVHP